MTSLYDILQVSPAASDALIRTAYRFLAQQVHPDKNGGDPVAADRMRLVNHAYSILSDPAQRARYDRACGLRATERRGTGRVAAPSFNGIRPFVFRRLA